MGQSYAWHVKESSRCAMGCPASVRTPRGRGHPSRLPPRNRGSANAPTSCIREPEHRAWTPASSRPLTGACRGSPQHRHRRETDRSVLARQGSPTLGATLVVARLTRDVRFTIATTRASTVSTGANKSPANCASTSTSAGRRPCPISPRHNLPRFPEASWGREHTSIVVPEPIDVNDI
jgi:hypothetical protein